MNKDINENITWLMPTLFDDLFSNDAWYFKRHKIASYDKNDKQLSKEEAAKRQREYEEWRRQHDAKRKTEKEAASKEPRLAIRLALPPEYSSVPLAGTFFTSSEKEGQYEQVNTGPQHFKYPNTPFNIFTVYGPLSQLKQVFNKYGKMFFGYDAKGNKVKPNPDSISKCLVDANGNDLTFYMKDNDISEKKTMKKQYTKKQIIEAIAYWQKQLDQIDESFVVHDGQISDNMQFELKVPGTSGAHITLKGEFNAMRFAVDMLTDAFNHLKAKDPVEYRAVTLELK